MARTRPGSFPRRQKGTQGASYAPGALSPPGSGAAIGDDRRGESCKFWSISVAKWLPNRPLLRRFGIKIEPKSIPPAWLPPRCRVGPLGVEFRAFRAHFGPSKSSTALKSPRAPRPQGPFRTQRQEDQRRQRFTRTIHGARGTEIYRLPPLPPTP